MRWEKIECPIIKLLRNFMKRRTTTVHEEYPNSGASSSASGAVQRQGFFDNANI